MTSHLFTLFISPSNIVLVISLWSLKDDVLFLLLKFYFLCMLYPFCVFTFASVYCMSWGFLEELFVRSCCLCEEIRCPRLVSFHRISCQIRPGNLLLTWLVGMIHGGPVSSSIISFQGRRTLSHPHSMPPTPSLNPPCREESNHFPSGCVPDHRKYICIGELRHLVLLVLSPPYSNSSSKQFLCKHISYWPLLHTF